MIYEREFLNKRISELKKSLDMMDESTHIYFLTGKVLDLYEFELKRYTKRR